MKDEAAITFFVELNSSHAKTKGNLATPERMQKQINLDRCVSSSSNRHTDTHYAVPVERTSAGVGKNID